MTSPDSNHKLTFILEAYKNTESTIRFADAKAGAVVAAHALMLTMIKDYLDLLLSSVLYLYRTGGAILIEVLLILVLVFYALFIFSSLTFVLKTVVPRFSDIKPSYKITNLFWCKDLIANYKENGLKAVKAALEEADINQLISDLLHECVKLSDIAVQKMDTVGKAIRFTKYAFYFWGVIFILGLLLNYL